MEMPTHGNIPVWYTLALLNNIWRVYNQNVQNDDEGYDFKEKFHTIQNSNQ